MNFLKNIIILYLFISVIFSQCQDMYGDANNDTYLDIVDLVIIIDIIFNIEDYDDITYLDVNHDNVLNIIDVVILINRILDPFPSEINISNVQYDFNEIQIFWDSSIDEGFVKYNIYYSNFFDNEETLIYASENINQTSTILSEVNLKEQNFFWVGVVDFLNCEIIGQQYLYELPYKSYSLDDSGNIINSNLFVSDFSSATDCIDCHQEHYNEWSGSMHAYTMHSPLFFAYKNENKNVHPTTGEKFCMQCHNPISFLTNTDLSNYSNPNDFQSSNIEDVLKEGITCDVCHTRTGLSETVHGEGNMAANAIYKMYPTGNIKFGSIQNPQSNSYHESYYLPTYQSSQLCLPCHDLVINNIEAEITFTEWNRIPGFSMFGGVSCQECHMPLKEDGTHSHNFIGVDLDLSIPLAENPLYQDVQELLSSSATMLFSIPGDNLSSIISPGDTLEIPLTIESLTAHNFPSGTSFNREAWVEIKVYNDDILIFSSGLIDNDEELNLYDEQLLLFSSYLYDSQGSLTSNITEVDSMENYTLAPYQQRFKYYNVPIAEGINGNLTINARLLFRPFKPSLILGHHPEFIENLPIFEITQISEIVEIVE